MHRAVHAFSLLVALATGVALFAPAAHAADLCRDAYLSCVSSSNQCRADFDAQATQCRREVRAKWNECEQWHRTTRPGVHPRDGRRTGARPDPGPSAGRRADLVDGVRGPQPRPTNGILVAITV